MHLYKKGLSVRMSISISDRPPKTMSISRNNSKNYNDSIIRLMRYCRGITFGGTKFGGTKLPCAYDGNFFNVGCALFEILQRVDGKGEK